MDELVLERREMDNRTVDVAVSDDAYVSLSPPVDEDYWSYRVRLSDKQAVVGFPKYFTVGIGFAVEEDWNTNLPYTKDAGEILDHIWHNRGKSIPKGEESKARVRAAIELIQQAATEDRRVTP